MRIPAGLAQGLSLNTQRGGVGETVTFTISINNAPNDVDAFGLDVVYDQQVLEYEDFSPGGSVRGFDFFDVSTPTRGRLRVAGFSAGERIEVGNSGSLVTLSFRVRQAGQASLSMVSLVDDMAGWLTHAGRFETPPPLPQTEEPPPPTTPSQIEEIPLQPTPSRTEATASPPVQPASPRQSRAPSRDTRRILREVPTQVQEPDSTTPGEAEPRPQSVRETEPRQRPQATNSEPRPGAEVSSLPSQEATRSTTNRPAESQVAQDAAVSQSLAARETPLRVAQGEPTAPRETAGSLRRPSTPETTPTRREARARQDTPQAPSLLSNSIRVVVPLGALLLLGAVIIVLVSLKRRE